MTCAAIGKQIKPLDVFQYVPFFAVGMIAFEIQRRPALRLAFSKGWFGAVAAACLAFDLAFTNAPFPGLVTLPFMGVFFVAVACGNSFWGTFSTRGALVLGECSYGIYLIHGFVLSLLFFDGADLVACVDFSGVSAVQMPLAALVVVLVSSLAYRYIERPAINGGKRLARFVTDRPIRQREIELDVAP